MAVCRPRGDLVDDVHRRLARAGWLAHIAGGVVVFLAVGFLIPIFADPGERGELALLNGPPIVVYFVLAGVAIYHYMRRHIRRSLAWLTEGREPTDAEHRASLRLAVRETKVAALAWSIGVVGFAVYNGLVYSWDFALMSAATVWAGAETTCALNYLIAERILRPVTALALQARPATGMVAPGVRGRLTGAWLLGTGVPLLGVVTVGVAGILRSDVDSEYLAAAVLFLGLVAMASGVVATLFVAKAIAGPVIAVRRGLEQIERGDLDASVAVDDGSEVGLLQAGFNQMAEGLRERKHIRDLFGRQVGEDVAEAALVQDISLGGEEREIGALFVDIQGSTAMAMSLPPTEVVTLLNRFFHVVVEVVESERGMVNKFEGDAALCVFGAPVDRDDPAAGALRAADELARRLARDVPQISFGIGVSAGIAVAGNVGSERRFEYTVIGDPVNEAARLSNLAKRRGEPVLASDAALERAGEREQQAWEFIGSEVLRGRGQPTEFARPGSGAPAGAQLRTAVSTRQPS